MILLRLPGQDHMYYPCTPSMKLFKYLQQTVLKFVMLFLDKHTNGMIISKHTISM